MRLAKSNLHCVPCLERRRRSPEGTFPDEEPSGRTNASLAVVTPLQPSLSLQHTFCTLHEDAQGLVARSLLWPAGPGELDECQANLNEERSNKQTFLYHLADENFGEPRYHLRNVHAGVRSESVADELEPKGLDRIMTMKPREIPCEQCSC